jgi:hypothetical protein
VNVADADMRPTVAVTLWLPFLALGMVKEVEPSPTADEVGVATVLPSQAIVTARFFGKPLKEAFSVRPTNPDVGARLTFGVAAIA